MNRETSHQLAPIALFTYNRPIHTMETIKALQANLYADQSILYIFSDGPKTDKDEQKVKKVRQYLKHIKGFKKIEIIERPTNWGLAKNIIHGVTEIVNLHQKIIVLEDDIITSPYFLKFMNEALQFYQEEEKVMHISGYIPPIRTKGLPDTFFLKPTTCWGWATWKRAWKYFEKNPKKQINMLSKKQIHDFNLSNSYNHWETIKKNLSGEIDTWAVFWYLSTYLQDGLSLHPRDSLTQNIGHDSSGIHSTITTVFHSPLSNQSSWKFPSEIKEHPLARKRLEQFLRFHKFYIWKDKINSLLKTFFPKIIPESP